jgi:hypothetical protein
MYPEKCTDVEERLVVLDRGRLVVPWCSSRGRHVCGQSCCLAASYLLSSCILSNSIIYFLYGTKGGSNQCFKG